MQPSLVVLTAGMVLSVRPPGTACPPAAPLEGGVQPSLVVLTAGVVLLVRPPAACMSPCCPPRGGVQPGLAALTAGVVLSVRPLGGALLPCTVDLHSELPPLLCLPRLRRCAAEPGRKDQRGRARRCAARSLPSKRGGSCAVWRLLCGGWRPLPPAQCRLLLIFVTPGHTARPCLSLVSRAMHRRKAQPWRSGPATDLRAGRDQVWEGSIAGSALGIGLSLASVVCGAAMLCFSGRALSERLDVFRWRPPAPGFDPTYPTISYPPLAPLTD